MLPTAGGLGLNREKKNRKKYRIKSKIRICNYWSAEKASTNVWGALVMRIKHSSRLPLSEIKKINQIKKSESTKHCVLVWLALHETEEWGDCSAPSQSGIKTLNVNKLSELNGNGGNEMQFRIDKHSILLVEVKCNLRDCVTYWCCSFRLHDAWKCCVFFSTLKHSSTNMRCDCKSGKFTFSSEISPIANSSIRSNYSISRAFYVHIGKILCPLIALHFSLFFCSFEICCAIKT